MIYAFDDLELDTGTVELRRAGQVVPMEPQAFDVLALLVEHRARVVTKEEILDTVWGSRFVSESALTTRIKQARRAVGDDGQAQRLIKTAHGRGYRFVGAIRPRGAGAAAARTSKATALLERSRELEVLAAARARAEDPGQGSVVLVAGEAGIGKTSLVRAFCAAAGIERPLIGGCDDLASPRALGPLRDVARVPGSPLAAAFADDGDADAVLAATLDLLGDGPCVLVIEDVHWADDGTLDLLRLVARRIDQLPAVLVITYRDDELVADHPLRRVLGAMRGPHVERLQLAPLSTEAVARLTAASGRAADEIYDATRGNPFFVTEVLASPDDAVPPTVRDAVLSRLVGLSPEARSAVELVSVVPSRTERWLVDGYLDGNVNPLGEAERVGVLHVDREHVWFRHELARRAVADALARSQYLHLNKVVLDRLGSRDGADVSRLVHHASQAGETDRMLTYADRAVDDTLRLRAYRQTIDYTDLLLQHRERLSGPQLVEVLTRRGYALYVLNRLEESAGCGHLAVAASAEHPEQHIDALLILSRAAYWVEGPDVAAACVRQAIDALEGAGHAGDDVRLAAAYADLARARSNLVTVGIVAEPDPRVVDAAATSLALAEALGRTDLQSHALQYLGSGRLALGDPGGADDLERAVSLAEVDPRDELPVRACVNAAGGFFRAGRFDDAERFVALGLDRASSGDFDAGVYRLEMTRAAVMLADGRWDDASDLLADLIARPADPGVMRSLAGAQRARLLARVGRTAEADAVLAQARVGREVSRDVRVIGPLAAAELELAWLADRAATVPELVAVALDESRLQGHRSTEAELVAYLRRAGHEVTTTGDPPGPWAPTLAGDHRGAAAAWSTLGDRYEAAVERSSSDDPSDRAAARSELDALGAVATLARLGSGA